MSAVYLEHYLDSLEQLPVELQRNFMLMRELDSRSQELLRAIDRAADALLSRLDSDASKDKSELSSDERREAVASIQAQYVKVREYADDKVQLAIQTYELVDKHIRRLDSDLARFESDIQERAEKSAELHITANKRKQPGLISLGRKKIQETGGKKKKKRLPVSSPREDMMHGAVAGAGAVTTANTTTNQPLTNIKKKKKKDTSGSGGNTEEKESGDKRKTGGDEELIDMPVDPNEPVYCLCQQVSYGQMIGCDYPDCPIEWFHFACVNLTVKPKGKWFCPRCTSDKKHKK